MKSAPNSEPSFGQAWRGMVTVASATVAFGLWHSLLCSDGAKNAGRQLLGDRRGTGLYRAFFMAQSVVTTGALFALILRTPHRTLYKAQGLKRWLGWAGQAAAIGAALWAYRDLDHARFWGIQGVRALKDDERVIEAQAQGPEVEKDDSIRAKGIFRYTRHPLEWAPVLLLLSSPVMKTNWLAFDLVAAIYSYFGALHEEKRLLRRSGKFYGNYQKQVPFFFGFPPKD